MNRSVEHRRVKICKEVPRSIRRPRYLWNDKRLDPGPRRRRIFNSNGRRHRLSLGKKLGRLGRVVGGGGGNRRRTGSSSKRRLISSKINNPTDEMSVDRRPS